MLKILWSFTFSLFGILLPVHAHMQMRIPPPRWSQYSTYYASNNKINYNLNSPLNVAPDYFTFPCKGFAKGPPTTTVFTNDIPIVLEGTATHGGGHCQFGITYDNVHFLVLNTVYDNCLIDSLEYTLTLPPNIPQSNFTIFWTWINKIGNREYYMDCVDISLINGNILNEEPVIIYGKSLLVVNLPGFPIIPEFPHEGMYNGQDLLNNRPNIGFSFVFAKKNPNNSHSTTIETGPQRPTQTTQTIPISTGSCQNGKMMCQGTLMQTYNICDNGIWRTMPCATGTTCKTIDASTIICG